MKDFLKEYIDIEPGEIREAETDRVLGYHEGAIFYTIGQRHGLYLSGEKGAVNDGLPYYIVAKDLERNLLYVSKNLNHELLWTSELSLRDIVIRTGDGTGGGPAARAAIANTLGEEGATEPVQNIQVRLRHRAPLVPATFDGETLYFAAEVKRPAAGQSAVLYDGEVCLGGGIII